MFMRPKNVVESRVKCPKCKSNDLTLTELWKDHSITWEQESGKFDRNAGELEMGDAYKVQAKCSKCNHVWTLRGVLQIDEIKIKNQPNENNNN